MCATTCSATPCAISVGGEEVKRNWRFTCIQTRDKSSCRSKQKLRLDSLQILHKIALLLMELIASSTNVFQVSFVYLHTRGTGVCLHPHKNGRDATVLDGSLEAWRSLADQNLPLDNSTVRKNFDVITSCSLPALLLLPAKAALDQSLAPNAKPVKRSLSTAPTSSHIPCGLLTLPSTMCPYISFMQFR